MRKILIPLFVFFCAFCHATSPAILHKARHIKLLALDVDGVLTNGEIAYSSSGKEFMVFNAKDGLGLVRLSQNNFITAIITGRRWSSIVNLRGKELQVHHIYQDVKDKQRVIRELADLYSLEPDEICYIGDDLPDLSALRSIGFACCPADAVAQVRNACHWVSKYEGGRGAVRELADLLLDAQGK